jgi:hypothetical protein
MLCRIRQRRPHAIRRISPTLYESRLAVKPERGGLSGLFSFPLQAVIVLVSSQNRLAVRSVRSLFSQ